MKSARLSVLLGVLLTVGLPVCLVSQSNQVTPNNQTGMVSYNTYSGDHEGVNLATGDLNLQIPLVHLPGRDHHDLNLSYIYDSRIYQLTSGLDAFQNSFVRWDTVDGGGWRLNVPSLSKMQHCDPLGAVFDVYWGDFLVTLQDGSKHHFDNTAGHAYHQNACDGPITGNPPGQGVGYNSDASLRLDTPDSANAVLHFKDGSSMVFYNYLVQNNQIDLKDNNGNIITYFSDGTNYSITDSLGRVVTLAFSSITYGPGLATFLPTSISYPGSDGTPQTILFGYSTHTHAPAFSTPAYSAPPAPLPVLSSITLPNTRSYGMEYNNFDEITKITYPTGGYTRYVYGVLQGWYQLSILSGSGDVRVVTNSYFCGNASGSCISSEERSTTYSATRQPSNQNNTAMTVTDALGNYTTYTFSDAGPIGGFSADCAPASPRELSRTLYDSAGHTLRSVTTEYNTLPDCGNGPTRMFPVRRTTTLDDGKVTKTEWDLDTLSGFSPSFLSNNIKEERIFDYGSLSVPVVKHRYTYLKVNPVNGVDYQNTLFILDRKASEQVYDSRTGTDVLMAQTTYEYDSYTAGLSASAATKHDPAYSTGYTTRGNVTAVTHWRNTDGASLTSRNQYDDAGNVLSTADPLLHLTQFSYTDNFTDGVNRNAKAYVTQITHPATGSVNHIERMQYFFGSGLVAASCGQNFPAATVCNTSSFPQPDYAIYQYDAMNRLVQVKSGDSTVKTTTPNDVPPASSTSNSPITSGVSLTTAVTVDGAGRTVQSRLTSDPEGIDYTDTTYDALGRVATVSNPYRSTGDPTYGITTFQYDALGRAKQVTKQDGSVSQVSYTSNCTTATDEAGKTRKSCSDAMGRLIEVDEPGAGTAGASASGGLTISGTLQTKSATNAVPGIGSVTISGSEQSKAGTPATPGHVSITITGSEQSTLVCTNFLPDDSCGQWDTFYDSGTVTVTVNGHSDSTFYEQNHTTTSIAAGLAIAINGDSAASVTASASGPVLTLTSKATGTAGNVAFSTSVTYDSSNFFSPSFAASPASGSLTGGAAAGPLVYDHGTCTATINGTPYSRTFGQGDTPSTIASGLAGTITAGTLANASASSGTINLTAKTGGAATNYSLVSTCTYDSANFSSASFSASRSGANLTGGLDGSPAATDSGTVQLTIGSVSVTANYGNAGGQDATASAVAADLVAKVQAQIGGVNPPFSISAAGAGININWSSVGTAGNVAVSTTSTTSLPGSFSKPSFASCSITTNPQACNTALSGGVDPIAPSLSAPYVTLYKYDALSNLYCVEQHGSATSGTACPSTPPGPTDSPIQPDPNNPWRRRLFAYNSLSQLRWASNPESGVITYTYDNDGLLLQKTSPAPNVLPPTTATQTVSFCYDILHRVTGKGYGAQSCPLATPVVSYTYDSVTYGIGRLTSLTDQAGTANYTYDIMGRIKTETRTLPGDSTHPSVSKTLTYDYNLDGSLKTLTYPSNNVITYTPSSAGRMLSAVDSGSGVINYATGATYIPAGNLHGLVNGNSATFTGITNFFSYNKRLQPIQMQATAPGVSGPVPVLDLTYDFHLGNGTSGADNGNVYGILNNKDHPRDQTFTYDALNRLISAQNAGTDCAAIILGGNKKFWGNTYTYDAWGNLTNKTKIPTACGGENLQVNAGADNRLQSGYLYDSAGNMTFNATPPTQTYTYDQENRLTGPAGFTYTYDADGNRVRKSNGNTASSGTLYWYMAPGIVGESDLAGVMKSEYVFFDGERVARRDLVAPTGVFYYFSDHLKTASVITDSAGVIKDESDYYPWGGELKIVDNDPNHYIFTGKERDLETGLDYFGARYYSNGLGRWVSADWSPTPIPVPYADFGDPQSLNLYGYVRNLPTSRADIDGHESGNAGGSGPRLPFSDSISVPEPQFPEFEPHFATPTCILCQSAPEPRPGSSTGKPTNQPVDPIPTGPDGKPSPPPVQVPGCPECEWKWFPDSGNDRGGQWKPVNYPKTPEGIPDASWDPGSRGGPGHWDVNDGKRNRERYYPDGRPMPKDVAHPPGWRPTWKQVGVTVGAIGVGYVIYRVVRMVPSVVIPPLWPTIIPNAVIP